MKRALLTGGSGFIGANLARRLLADGHDVHLLVRPGFNGWRLEGIRDDIHLHEADITDQEAVERVLLGSRPDWIFHLAAHGAYPTETDLSRMLRTNVHGTISMLSGALNTGVEAFVNAGSSSEYGFKDHAPSESELVEPNSNYAVTKASATLFCRLVGWQSGANVTTLRLYSAYGPWEQPSRLMPTLVARGLEGRLPELASPSIARDFVFVDDVVDAFLAAANHPQSDPGAVYNIGTGVQTSLAEVVRLARSELAISTEPQWGSMEDRSWDTAVWVSDSGRARNVLGWQPQLTVREGFRRLVEWVKSSEVMAAYYRERAGP